MKNRVGGNNLAYGGPPEGLKSLLRGGRCYKKIAQMMGWISSVGRAAVL